MASHAGSCVLAVALLLAGGPGWAASLKDIQTSRLPQEKAVLQVYADVAEVEPFVRGWTPTWNFPTPKERVVAVMKQSVDRLRDASRAAPDNHELALLTGLVAHYAHNLDVDGGDELAVRSFTRAQSLSASDERSRWFLGLHECQAGKVRDGMARYLAIEERAGNEMNGGFWDDYRTCALLASMPAHALRATERIAALDSHFSKTDDTVLGLILQRYKNADASATYAVKDIWSVDRAGERMVFVNHLFGLEFTCGVEQQVGFSDARAGACSAQLAPGAFTGKSGKVSPTIVVVARLAKPGETLDDFTKTLFRSVEGAARTAVGACPADNCAAYEGVKPGGYGTEGDAHLIATSFARSAPAFPGLLFERPLGPPAGDGGRSDAPRFYRPTERWQRFPGTMFYVVLLDTADSVLGDARAAYEKFLKGMRVE